MQSLEHGTPRLISRTFALPSGRSPVDWDAIEREAGSRVESQWLHWLHVRDEVAELRAGDDSNHTAGITATPIPATRTRTDDVPQRWGKYVLMQVVGEGGFGAVFRAWDPDLELEVAIKVLHRRVTDSALKHALLQEGRALARIKHNNVVRVLSVESQDDQIALRMEFVHGETLEDVLRRNGTLSAHEAASIGADLCRALAAVHDAGFVHRDVKARNVMRERDGRIVLMDFGAGRQADDLKVPGRIPNVGTPLYMAPEVMAGQPATPASDVYGAGVLLYYLVTGQHPVEGSTPDDIRRAHAEGRRRPLLDRRLDIPIAYARIVERALARDPAARYTNAAALLDDLEKTFGTSTREAPATIQNRLRLAGAAVVVATLVLVLLGIVNSLEFNYGLGRTEFARETVLDWIWLGFRSSVGTIFTLLLLVFVCSLAVGLHRIAVTASASVRQANATARAVLLRGVRALRLDDPHAREAFLLLVSAGLLVSSWMYFEPLFGDLLLGGNIWSASADKLHLLSPVNRPYHYLYRKTFTGVLISSGAALYMAWKFGPARRDGLHHALVAGLSTVFVLAMLSLDLPFRLLYTSDFSAVRWHGTDCYRLEERPDDVLLFCPALTPRNRLVKREGGGIEDLGRTENIFTQFGNARGSDIALNR